MKICVLDASTQVASVAMMEEGKLIYESNLIHGLTHSEKLMPLVEAAFTLTGWEPTDVDVYGVVEGPGSFTGLRIGVATVKGLAQACLLYTSRPKAYIRRSPTGPCSCRRPRYRSGC